MEIFVYRGNCYLRFDFKCVIINSMYFWFSLGHGPTAAALLHQFKSQYLPHWQAVWRKVIGGDVSTGEFITLCSTFDTACYSALHKSALKLPDFRSIKVNLKTVSFFGKPSDKTGWASLQIVSRSTRIYFSNRCGYQNRLTLRILLSSF